MTAIGLAACLQNSPAAAETERLWLSNCLAIHDDVEAMETAFLSSGFRHSRPEDHEKIAELLVLSSLATSVLNNTSDQILEGWDKLYELNREVLSLPPYVEGGPSRGIQVRVFLDETSIVRVSFEDDEQWGKSTNCDIYLGGPYPGWMLEKLESAFKKANQHGAVWQFNDPSLPNYTVFTISELKKPAEGKFLGRNQSSIRVLSIGTQEKR